MSIFDKGLSGPVADNLRRLDPARDHTVAADATLRRMATELLEREQAADLVEGWGRRHPRSRRRAWAVVSGAAAIVAAVAVAVAVFARQPSGHAPALVGPAGVAQATVIPPPYRALAGQANPLSAAMSVDCNGVTVAVPMLAAPGGVERGTSAASVALRHFLAHNPWAGAGSVTDRNWLLLSRTGDTLTFGQRIGRIGVGSVVTLTGHGASWRASSEGGCGPVIPAPQQSGEPVEATADGADLVLRWMNGSNCGNGPAKTERTLARVLVQQTSTVVHVLVISKPSPDAGPTTTPCAGVGLESTTRVHLAAPLGKRTLVDDARVPGVGVRIGP